ncbi:MAG: Gfo/Idh/MocA family oxidoreductase [Saprospiraceae bacterium]|nr:Gfo/Idh/MocA family oxidoreductase [Saprospiraceae bacterium]
MKRRTFIQNSTIAGLGVTVLGKDEPKKSSPFKSNNGKLKVGVIGTGLRGQGHADLIWRRDDCDLVAICDISQRMIDRTKAICEKHGKKLPTIYQSGPHAYKEMLEQEDLDAVIIATPWRWHVPMAIEAMEQGVYVGMEVSGAASVDECWQLVRTSERTGSHLYFLENVCFRRDVMAILAMVREGLFGEMMHLECGYQHDLRGVKFNDGETAYNSGAEFGEKGYSEARWRTQHSVTRNGDLYPTHGIGPVAQYTDLNRGNRMLFLTSMATKSRGLHEYIVNHPKGGPDHPNATVDFKLGDKVTTMVKTVNGETIVLHHDTNLPRPYSLGFRVQGTKGLWMKVRDGIHIEGLSKSHRWEDSKTYLDKYDHPLWKRYEQRAIGAGHGGMDFFLMHSFIEHAKRGETPPFDVYDAASWMAITPLSEQSIAMGSAPVYFPDFTDGKWIDRKNTFAHGDEY